MTHFPYLKFNWQNLMVKMCTDNTGRNCVHGRIWTLLLIGKASLYESNLLLR